MPLVKMLSRQVQWLREDRGTLAEQKISMYEGSLNWDLDRDPHKSG